MELAGVYVIKNAITGEEYVGVSTYAAQRIRQHRQQLRKGKHPNKQLQDAWTRDGEAAFTFEGLEMLPSTATSLEREEAEARWIAKLKPAYNRISPYYIPMRVESPV